MLLMMEYQMKIMKTIGNNPGENVNKIHLYKFSYPCFDMKKYLGSQALFHYVREGCL